MALIILILFCEFWVGKGETATGINLFVTSKDLMLYKR